VQAVAAVLFGRKPVEVRAVAALAEEVQVHLQRAVQLLERQVQLILGAVAVAMVGQ
jgi:hypothetical protein|tara:strand:+ start:253 stop:420 length:168 start_codon:yes stop_codon:yes gene_type:complete